MSFSLASEEQASQAAHGDFGGDYIKLLAGQIVDMITMGNVSDQERAALEEEIEQRIIYNLHQVFLDNLDEEGQVMYKRLLNESQSFRTKEFHNFLENHVADYDSRVKEAMDNFMGEAYELVERRLRELRSGAGS
jgi:tryptophanyl-tRNA synthetase